MRNLSPQEQTFIFPPLLLHSPSGLFISIQLLLCFWVLCGSVLMRGGGVRKSSSPSWWIGEAGCMPLKAKWLPLQGWGMHSGFPGATFSKLWGISTSGLTLQGFIHWLSTQKLCSHIWVYVLLEAMAYGRQLERWSSDTWQGTLPLTYGRVRHLPKFTDTHAGQCERLTQVLSEFGESDPWSSVGDDLENADWEEEPSACYTDGCSRCRETKSSTGQSLLDPEPVTFTFGCLRLSTPTRQTDNWLCNIICAQRVDQTLIRAVREWELPKQYCHHSSFQHRLLLCLFCSSVLLWAAVRVQSSLVITPVLSKLKAHFHMPNPKETSPMCIYCRFLAVASCGFCIMYLPRDPFVAIYNALDRHLPFACNWLMAGFDMMECHFVH